MRALIIVAGAFPVLKGLTSHTPAPLVPCGDRPILQHLVEYLVDQGVATFDFVLHESPREIEQFLGDGTRWGSRFTFHLVSNPDAPYEPLRLVPCEGQPILLVHADRIPILLGRKVLEENSDGNTLFYTAAGSTPPSGVTQVCASEWTGSAILQASAIRGIPSTVTQVELEERLWEIGASTIAHVDLLDLRRFETFLDAQHRILTNSPVTAYLPAREVEPGVWIGRNVMIHPTAQLTPPLFIGEIPASAAARKLVPMRLSVMTRSSTSTRTSSIPR